jgi:glycine hydroxymethyltransferase
MALPSGGHLTHGWKVSVTGAFFNAQQYGVRKDDHRIDFDEVSRLAKEHKPKLLWCGATAYPRVIDYDKFAEIARSVGAILVADIAHISGLIAAGAHPSPFGKAEIVTSTTHKTLRGPRGGMILCDEKHAKAIDKAVFPGLQGGPHNSTTAAIAVAAKEASTPEFKKYGHAVVENAKALADALLSRGFSLVTGGTENHLILADLTPQNVSGKIAAQALDRAGMVCNYNSVPFDTRKPFDPSGIRLGTAAITSRGMGPAQMKLIGNWMADVVAAPTDDAKVAKIAKDVEAMCNDFPAPGLPR